ncbi:MAG: phage protein [Lachnospiraceae bacterium]
MADNWDRQYRFAAGKPGTVGFEIGEEVAGRALRIVFDLEKTDVESGNTGTITIYNLNDEHVAMLKEKDCMVTLKAGYGANMPLIFSGNITTESTSDDNPDRETEIQAVDGRVAIRDTFISVSYTGETLAQSIYNDIIGQMGITCVYSPKAQELLSAFKLENGFAFVGTAADCLTQLGAMCGLNWTIQNGVGQVLYPGDPITTQCFVLDESSGLVNIPKSITINAETTTNEEATQEPIHGFEINYLLNGAIGINDMIQLVSKKVSGFFRIKSIKISGDNYGSSWMCTAQIVEVKEAPA